MIAWESNDGNLIGDGPGQAVATGEHLKSGWNNAVEGMAVSVDRNQSLPTPVARSVQIDAIDPSLPYLSS